jgi:hypothetical protein
VHLSLLCPSQLTWVSWALRLNQNTVWCIPLDSTAYLYLRSKVDYISTTWACQKCTKSCLDQSQPEGCNQFCSFLWAHIPWANNDLKHLLWMKSISNSNHHLHNIILEKLILANMNTIHDEYSSSWIQKKFLHPSVGSLAQTHCPSSSLVPWNTIPDSNPSSLRHIKLHRSLYHN